MENYTWEKERIINYMKGNCCGYMNAKPRKDIVNATFIDDRTFRDICADIPQIITSSHIGYYIMPDKPSISERNIALEALKEHRRRGIASLVRNRKQRQFVAKLGQEELQPVLF